MAAVGMQSSGITDAEPLFPPGSAEECGVQGIAGSPWLRTRGLQHVGPSSILNGGHKNSQRGVAERRSGSGHVSPRPPSASPGAGHLPRPGTADAAARRQLESLEERLSTSIAALHRQQVADRQETDRLAELSASRLEARLSRIEQQQLRLERRSAEFAGVVRGLGEEQQAQDRRVEGLQERLRSLQMSSQAQEECCRRFAELEEEHKALAGIVQTSAAADEEVQRRYMQRFRQVELQVEDQIRMALGDRSLQVEALLERFDALEAHCKSSGTSAASLAPGAIATPLRSIPRGAQQPAEHAGLELISDSTSGRLSGLGTNDALGETGRSAQAALLGDEALLAVQELEATLNQELQVIHERCNFVQDCLDERVLAPMRRFEQKLTDHEMKVEQLLSDGQDRSAKVEEHEVRLGVTRSKLDAHEQRLSLVSDKVDRALRAEKVAAVSAAETGSPQSLSFAPRLVPSAFSSQASLSQHPDAGGMPGSSGTLGGVSSIVALERRLLQWESTVEELQLQHQQQAVANKEMASAALEKADATATELQDLGARLSGGGPSNALLAARVDELDAQLRQSLANLNARLTEDSAASAAAGGTEALRRELAERLTELARHAQAGFTDVREHLDTVSRQLSQLRARVQQNEEALASPGASQVPAAMVPPHSELDAIGAPHGATPGVPAMPRPPVPVVAGFEAMAALRDLEVRMRENEGFAGTLRQGLLVVQQILADVKRSIDIALVERRGGSRNSTAAASDDEQPTAAFQHALAARIERAEAAVAASAEELAVVRDRPSISPEEVGAVEQRLLEASERAAARAAHQASQELQRLAADAEMRLQANEAATVAVQKRLDDLPLSLSSLPARFAAFEERLLQSEASSRRDLQQVESSGHQALLSELDRRHTLLVAALLGTPVAEGDAKGEGDGHAALTNFGTELRALLQENSARLQQAQQGVEVEQPEAQPDHAAAATVDSEYASVLQRLERAEHDLEEQRRLFQWLEHTDRELEEHRRMLQLQVQPSTQFSEAALQTRFDSLERELAEQRRWVQQHDKSVADFPAIHRGLEARLEASLEALGKRLAFAEQELQEKLSEDTMTERAQVPQRLSRLESGFEEQRQAMQVQDEHGRGGLRADMDSDMATRASVEDLTASVSQLQQEMAGLRGVVDRQQRLAGPSDSWDGWNQHATDMHLGRSVSASSTGVSVHQPAPEHSAEAAGGHGSGAASSAAAASAAAAAASAAAAATSAAASAAAGAVVASHVEDAEAGGGGPAVGSSALMVTHYVVEDAEAGGGGRAHGTPPASASTDAEAAGGGPTSRATIPPAPSRPASSAHSSSSAVTQPHLGMSRWEESEAETSAGIHLGMAEAETSAGPSPSPGQARRLLAVALWEGAEAAGGFPAPGPSPASASSAPALHANTIATGADSRNEGEGDGVASDSTQPWAIQPSDAGGGPGPAAAGLVMASAPVGLPPTRDAVAGSGGAEADAGGGDAEAEDVSSSQWGRLLNAIQAKAAASSRAEIEERLESLRVEERLRPEVPTTAAASTASSGQLDPDSTPGPHEPEWTSGPSDRSRGTNLHSAHHAEPELEQRLPADAGSSAVMVAATEDTERSASGDLGARQVTSDLASARSEASSDALRQEQRPVRHLHFAVSGPAVSQRGEVFCEDLPSGRHSASSSSSPSGRPPGIKTNFGVAGTTGSAAGSSPSMREAGNAAGSSPSARDDVSNSGDGWSRSFPRILGDADTIEDFEEASEADDEEEVELPVETQNEADMDDDDLQEFSLNSEELQLAASTLSRGAAEEDSDATVEEEIVATVSEEEVTEVAPMMPSVGSTSHRALLAGGDEGSSEDDIEDFVPTTHFQVSRTSTASRPAVPPAAHQVTSFQDEDDMSSDEEVEIEFAAAAKAQQWGRGKTGAGRPGPARLGGLQLDSAPRTDAQVQSARGAQETPRSVTSVLEVERRDISDDDSEADADESMESD